VELLTQALDLVVADGYWVMLSPPPGGSDEIHFTGVLTFTAATDGFDFATPQSDRIFCAESVHLKKASGEIISIARQGEAAGLQIPLPPLREPFSGPGRASRRLITFSGCSA